MSAGRERTEPAAPAPPTPPTQESARPAEASQPAVTTSMAAFGGNDSCPNCGARMAPDQRYCLDCGHRRGDPRLPFMDAVVFMEAMNAPGVGPGTPPPPPPPSESRSSSRMNANAALIAGVATLVLAIGVGFLIGRSGHESSNSQAQAPIKVIEVGGGGETAATPTEGAAESTGGATAAKGKGGGESALKVEDSGKATQKSLSNAKEGAHGGSEAVEKVLHTSGNVKLPEAEQEIGGGCEKGTAGCEGGEFKGNFFE